MTITYNWFDNQKTIIHIQFIDKWVWADYVPIRESLNAILDQAPQPIHFIADFRATKTLPVGSLLTARNAFSRRHINEGVIIAVGASSQIHFLVYSLFSLVPTARYRFALAATIDDASEKINTMQQSRYNI